MDKKVHSIIEFARMNGMLELPFQVVIEEYLTVTEVQGDNQFEENFDKLLKHYEEEG